MQFVPNSILRATCDVVYESYTYPYGFSTASLRMLSEKHDVVARVSNFEAIRQLKKAIPNLKAIWIEGNLSESEAIVDARERPNFTFRLKAVSSEMARAEREYEQSPELFDFRVVNDRTELWVERQLDAFLLALSHDARRESLYSAARDKQSDLFVQRVAQTLELHLLARRPDDLLRLTPREFERFIAELLEKDGYEVELTPETRDGGFDIIAVKRADIVVPQLVLVECKRYSHTKRVGVQPVRQLYGLVSQQNASAGLLVTSSFFTRPALDFQQSVGHRLGLRDYEALKEWLARYR